MFDILDEEMHFSVFITWTSAFAKLYVGLLLRLFLVFDKSVALHQLLHGLLGLSSLLRFSFLLSHHLILLLKLQVVLELLTNLLKQQNIWCQSRCHGLRSD
jgi:hypothetical protein